MIAPMRTYVENGSGLADAESLGDRIRDKVALYRRATPRELTYRLAELDQEWNVQRAVELTCGSASSRDLQWAWSSRKWFLLPALAASFMVQYAIKGWCPLVPPLRRLGFRTVAEINQERTALQMLRGDFSDLEIPLGKGTSESSASGGEA